MKNYSNTTTVENELLHKATLKGYEVATDALKVPIKVRCDACELVVATQFNGNRPAWANTKCAFVLKSEHHTVNACSCGFRKVVKTHSVKKEVVEPNSDTTSTTNEDPTNNVIVNTGLEPDPVQYLSVQEDTFVIPPVEIINLSKQLPSKPSSTDQSEFVVAKKHFAELLSSRTKLFFMLISIEEERVTFSFRGTKFEAVVEKVYHDEINKLAGKASSQCARFIFGKMLYVREVK